MRYRPFLLRIPLMCMLSLLVLLLTMCQTSEPMSGDTDKMRGPMSAADEQDTATDAPLPPAPALLDRALDYRTVRDDDSAAHDLQALLDNYPNVPEARRARYYLAESYAYRERWRSAMQAFQAFVDEPAEDNLTPPALFWLARCHEELGEGAKAIAVYEQYRSFDTILEPYAALRQAAQEEALSLFEDAAANYAHAARADSAPSQRASSFERAIHMYREFEQPRQALTLYEELLALAQVPEYRARILDEAADLAEKEGNLKQAYRWRVEIVTLHAKTAQAVAVVRYMREQGDIPLLYARAAKVLFFAGDYTHALPLFDVALAQAYTTTPAGKPDDTILELRRLRAMTLRALDDDSSALHELALVGALSPDGEVGRQAQLDWIQTLGQSGETLRAANAYRQYAATYADDSRAPEALDRAAQLFDRLGDAEKAFFARMDLELLYPENEVSPYVLHSAAIGLFYQNRFDEALHIWQQVAEGRDGFHRARALFWAARVAQQQGNDEQAQEWLSAAQEAGPDTYYGARAADVLGVFVQGDVPLDAALVDDDWDALDAWVATWHDRTLDEATDTSDTSDTSDTTHTSYPMAILQNGFVQRAIALNQVGLWNEAKMEWNSAHADLVEEPSQLMLLARVAHERDMPSVALQAAERLQALAPPDAPPTPQTLRRLLYPTPFVDSVVRESQAFNIDPRLLYALIRQESRFDPYATSWVGARGLGQVMPATGKAIAQQLGVEGFHIDDLYHPHVSVRFGAYYIAQQITMMNGSVQAGLAAYNGGPGNAQRWANGFSVPDPDVFVERIDFGETKGYVRLVYGFYGAYQRLYALP